MEKQDEYVEQFSHGHAQTSISISMHVLVYVWLLVCVYEKNKAYQYA